MFVLLVKSTPENSCLCYNSSYYFKKGNPAFRLRQPLKLTFIQAMPKSMCLN